MRIHENELHCAPERVKLKLGTLIARTHLERLNLATHVTDAELNFRGRPPLAHVRGRKTIRRSAAAQAPPPHSNHRVRRTTRIYREIHGKQWNTWESRKCIEM